MKFQRAALLVISTLLGFAAAVFALISALALFNIFYKFPNENPITGKNIVYPLMLVVAGLLFRMARDLWKRSFGRDSD